MSKKENETIISQLKPYPISEQIRKWEELRNSDKFADISIRGRAPKGDFCDFCENIATKYEPRICSWNGDITDIVDYAYCQFFNSRLIEEKGDTCNSRYRKCLACYLQTANKDKTDED